MSDMQAMMQDGPRNDRGAIAGKHDRDAKPCRPASGPGLAVRILATVSITAVLLLLLEFTLRAFGVGFVTELLQPCTQDGRPASCYNLFFVAPFFPPGMIKTPQVYAIPRDKSPGTYRIFVLGESAAMGDPDPAYSFSRYLDVMLRKAFPARHFEVVNTGSVAINSHVLLPIAKGLAGQRADVFILYSGNNEVVGPYGAGTALTGSSMRLPLIRASILLHSTRVGQLLTKIGTPKREWGGMEMFLEKQVPANSPLLQSTYKNFDANLRDTITVARQAGARVIVATIATNLKDCAPFGSMHREGLSEKELQSWSRLVQQGVALEEGGATAEALKAFLAAGQIDDQYAELAFRIARSRWALGDYVGARRDFYRARDLDTLRFRADTQINEINRSAARAGAEVVDADSLFSQASANGVVGSELVYEHVHLTPLGNYLLAQAMFLQIASQLSSGDSSAPSLAAVPTQAECEERLALTHHDRTRITREMFDRVQKPPFTNQLNHTEQVLRLALRAEIPDENPQQTAAEYQRAIALKPDDRLLHYNFGLFLFNYNRNAALRELQLSRPWDGFPVFAPDGTLM